jgi:hypothetical protein
MLIMYIRIEVAVERKSHVRNSTAVMLAQQLLLDIINN